MNSSTKLCICFLEGPRAGKKLSFTDRETITFGRDTTCDIVFKTDTFQCVKEQGIEKYEIVGGVKYVSGQLESLYRVRARIKFYSSSGKLIARSYESFVEITNNTMYLGEIAHFQINTALNNVENIGTTQRVTKCEVEYLVWPERNPDTQRSNVVEARYGKEYTIEPQPNERYNLTIVRQE